MKRDPQQLLLHAFWHCMFGSDSTFERTPDYGDKDAAAILRGLWQAEAALKKASPQGSA